MSYDHLYAAREDNILWGEQPGRLVKRIGEFLAGGRVLDAGCGDGKNALFLEQEGFEVVGFDQSPFALQGLRERFKRAGKEPKGNYNQCDDLPGFMREEFDALVSYGLFHCLPQYQRVEVHRQLQSSVRPKGYILFTTLTDKIPLPDSHGTEEVVLASLDEIDQLFRDIDIKERLEGEIVEDHLPVIGEHKHSAVWIVGQKR
ncbi:MAG TPA: class I SAM-dependent methyltransferase [Candidatus Nanoarchaeia archaeon]|nr:class I SAM-dependent methyltransferase [Candidatus Nanoarchaeia archaeon]